ncbi:MAG: SDR family oxidoreductase [Rhodospirillaceae bacterium]|nr:SDR family oxidoreductase [Rhodospirillaceae bacterium]
MQRLSGKVALVTGGAGNLGRAMCERLAAEGARVAVADLRADKTESVVRDIGAAAIALVLDVTREESWQAAIAAVTAKWGKLDILVNNAGYLKPATIEEATLTDWRTTMQINGDGTFLGCKYAVAAMKAHGGAIINLSSTMGLRGVARHPAYTASKAAVRLLTRSVAKHCGEQGYAIRVNALLPGPVDSDMLRLNVPAGTREADYLAQVRDRHALGRLGTPRDIADAVVFLAGDESAFMTGADLVVDGGSTI